MIRLRSALLVTLPLLLAACQGGPMPVRELNQHPERWEGRTVRLAGRVKGAVMVSGWNAYELQDSTGVVLVVTNQYGTPLGGVPIGLEGEFRRALLIEDRPRIAVIEKRRWNPERGKPAPPESAAPSDS
jgi:hypothetical protein